MGWHINTPYFPTRPNASAPYPLQRWFYIYIYVPFKTPRSYSHSMYTVLPAHIHYARASIAYIRKQNAKPHQQNK